MYSIIGLQERITVQGGFKMYKMSCNDVKLNLTTISKVQTCVKKWTWKGGLKKGKERER